MSTSQVYRTYSRVFYIAKQRRVFFILFHSLARHEKSILINIDSLTLKTNDNDFDHKSHKGRHIHSDYTSVQTLDDWDNNSATQGVPQGIQVSAETLILGTRAQGAEEFLLNE